jgi:FAD synthetase
MKKTKIMIFGTFDVLHLGHIHFFKQARKLAKNPYLIISIARDTNAIRIKKVKPYHSEKDRKALVEELKIVDKVLLGDKNNYLKHIISEKPDIIALGYDQFTYTEKLEEDLLKNKLKTKIKRLKEFKPNIYKSSYIKNRKN